MSPPSHLGAKSWSPRCHFRITGGSVSYHPNPDPPLRIRARKVHVRLPCLVLAWIPFLLLVEQEVIG